MAASVLPAPAPRPQVPVPTKITGRGDVVAPQRGQRACDLRGACVGGVAERALEQAGHAGPGTGGRPSASTRRSSSGKTASLT